MLYSQDVVSSHISSKKYVEGSRTYTLFFLNLYQKLNFAILDSSKRKLIEIESHRKLARIYKFGRYNLTNYNKI